MSEAFDPYREWLQIESDERPPHHYDLLGVNAFESDGEKIDEFYRRRYSLVRKYQVGERSAFALQLVIELAKAHDCLTNEDARRAYDEQLREAGVTDTEQPREAYAREPESEPEPEPQPESVAAEPIQRVDAVWYLKTPDGLRFGPMTKDELDQQVRHGNVSSKCQVFRDGWAQPRWAYEVYTHLRRDEVPVATLQPQPVAAAGTPYQLLTAGKPGSKKPLAPLLIACGVGVAAIIGIIIWMVSLMGGDGQDGNTVVEKDGKGTVVQPNATTYTGSQDEWTEEARFPKTRAVALSKSGRWLALADSDGAIRIWNMEDKRFVQTLNGSSRVTHLMFGREHSLFAARRNVIERWEWPTGNKVKEYVQGSIGNPVHAFCVDERDQFLYVAHRTRDYSWTLSTGREELVSSYPTFAVKQAAHRRIMGEIYSAGDQGARVARLSSPPLRFKTISGLSGKAMALGFGQSDIKLAVAYSDKLVLWNVVGKKIEKTISVPAGTYMSVAFSKFDREIFLGRNNGQIHRFGRDGKARFPLSARHAVTQIIADSRRDRMITCSDVVRIWRRGPGGPGEDVLAENVTAAPREMRRYFPQLRYPDLATVKKKKIGPLVGPFVKKKDDAQSPKLAKTEKKKKKSETPKVIPKPQPTWTLEKSLKQVGIAGAYCIAFHPTDDDVLVSGHEQSLMLWNTSGQAPKPLVPKAGRVRAVAFSKDGGTVAYGHSKRVELLSLATGEKSSFRQATPVSSVDISPQGEFLGVAQKGGKSIQVWNVAGHDSVGKFNGHPRLLYRIRFHPNSNHLVAVGLDNKVRIFDPEGQVSGTWTAPGVTTINDLSFNGDGTLLASAAIQKILVWKADGSVLRSIGRPPGSLSPFGRIAFHPKENLVAAAIVGEKIARIWSVETGKVVAELRGATSPITSISFNASGNRIACGTQGPGIVVWKYNQSNASLPLRPSSAAAVRP